MQRRLAAGGVVIVGVVVVILAFANDLFTVAPAFEDLTDGFRDTVMTDEAIEQAQQDIAALAAVNEEFPAVVAGLAEVFGTDPASFQQTLATEFPAVATGAEALPSIVDNFTNVIGLIESQQENFEKADAIPTESIPATTLPWIIVGIGAAAIVVGGFMFTGRRAAAFVAIGLGVVVVASTLILSLPDKSQAADDMNEAFKPVYTEELVVQSAQALEVVGAMGDELQTAVIPAVAQQMGMTAEETVAFIGEQFPATGAALQALPDAMGRFQVMVATFGEQLDNYLTISDTALAPITTSLLIAGVLIALFGIWAALAPPSKEATTATEPKVTART